MSVISTSNGTNARLSSLDSCVCRHNSILEEDSFRAIISLERKRTERSRKPFILMLIDMAGFLSLGKTGKTVHRVLTALSSKTRETDITGWYKNYSVVGVVLTEIGTTETSDVVSTMLGRVNDILRTQLTMEQFSHIHISFHPYPEEWDQSDDGRPSNPVLYPDLITRDESQKLKRLIKRLMDVMGSLVALVILSPVFVAVAAAIRLSSPGPVLFRQRRVGQHGVPFELLKFRSMHVDSDPTIHKEYVTKLVTGTADKQPTNGSGQGVYKLTADPRVTRIGLLLRRSSLDELPQFINVLKGEMSLVGPRPPLWYEVEAYDLWHRRRVLEARPGITGLWQVNGRNRVNFDDMVRLDLTYAQTWTPWLDLKILLRTPIAVIEGAH
jgi:lipopolysaccharide/colanic/teichoic acid biosynthesis glycosyltransferase